VAGNDANSPPMGFDAWSAQRAMGSSIAVDRIMAGARAIFFPTVRRQGITMLDHTQPVPVADDYLRVNENRSAALAGVTHRWELSEASSIDEAIELLAALHKEHPSVPIMVVSTQRTGQIRAAVTHSSAGFIPQSIHQNAIVGALKLMLANEPLESVRKDSGDVHPLREDAASIWRRIQSLTSQQCVVLRLIVRGKLNKQIAFELNVSMTTVKAHVSAILTKLGVQSRTQAVILVNKVNFTA
jgi:DNA-binding NarL/FixJ family response regulator